MLKFVNDSYSEFKKIQWPTKDQTIRLTAYVIGVSFTVGLLVAMFDLMFSRGLSLIIK